jgi:hypothetical protein
MNASKTEPLEIHADAALFREALGFTAAETEFIPRLIEKDYFCTFVQHLCALDVPGNGAIDVSDTRLQALRQQLDAQLKPVLRSRDFSRFALDRAFDVVRAVAGELRK